MFAGHGALPLTRLPSLRTELVQFLLENSDSPNTEDMSRGTYLNLFHLLQLDTEATLDVLRCAFVDGESPIPEFSSDDGANTTTEAVQENNMMMESQNLLIQNTVDALVQIIEKHISQADESVPDACPSKKDVGKLFEFIACYVACRKAHVSGGVLSQILEYLTSEILILPNSPACTIETSKKREKQLLALLEVVPGTDWDESYVLQLCEKANFHQVFMSCSFLYHCLRACSLFEFSSFSPHGIGCDMVFRFVA